MRVKHKVSGVTGTIKRINGKVLSIKRDDYYVTLLFKSRRCRVETWVTNKPENWERI